MGLKRAMLLLVLAIIIIQLIAAGPLPVHAWSNGGFSADPNSPKYGTHDFIAQRALDYVPDDLDSWIRNNLNMYLYGTELPDNENAPLGDGIGDTTHHHVYYHGDGTIQDDAAAVRAQASYQQTIVFLAANDYASAAKWMGVTSHYVDDMGVFGHVMGAPTEWGTEKHHEDYEAWVDASTGSYDAPFKACLNFSGQLIQVTAYNAALSLAHDTTFDDTGKGHTAKWMDDNYNPQDPAFQNRTCESLNHAVNVVADLVYSAAKETSVPEFNGTAPVLMVMIMCLGLLIIKKHPKSTGHRHEAYTAAVYAIKPEQG